MKQSASFFSSRFEFLFEKLASMLSFATVKCEVQLTCRYLILHLKRPMVSFDSLNLVSVRKKSAVLMKWTEVKNGSLSGCLDANWIVHHFVI